MYTSKQTLYPVSLDMTPAGCGWILSEWINSSSTSVGYGGYELECVGGGMTSSLKFAPSWFRDLLLVIECKLTLVIKLLT